jgi:hypothetical protein
MDSLTIPLSEEVPRAIQTLDFARTQCTYWEQNECFFLESFLPPEVIEHHLLPQVEQLRADVHRNYLPKHKRGEALATTPWRKRRRFFSTYTTPQRSSISSVGWWVRR